MSTAWSEVRRVVRVYSSAGRTGRRFAGWSIEHGGGRRFLPVMYAGVEGQLERLAAEQRIPFGERHR